MKNKKFLYIILNDIAGSGQAGKSVSILESLKRNEPFELIVKKTTHKHHASELAREFGERAKTCEGQAICVVIGGDGTMNEVVNGLGEDYLDFPVAFIPYGSGNDFARSEGVPLKPVEAFKHILEIEKASKLDVIRYEDKATKHVSYAVNSVGFGLDGAIVHQKNMGLDKKKSIRAFQFSKLSYISSLFTAYHSQTEFEVSIQANKKEWHIKNAILQLNANRPYFGGGIKIVPTASPDDDLLDVLLVEKLSFIELITLVGSVLSGRTKHLSHNKVHYIKASHYQMTLFTKQFGQADGEELPEKQHNYQFSTFKRSFWV